MLPYGSSHQKKNPNFLFFFSDLLCGCSVAALSCPFPSRFSVVPPQKGVSSHSLHCVAVVALPSPSLWVKCHNPLLSLPLKLQLCSAASEGSPFTLSSLYRCCSPPFTFSSLCHTHLIFILSSPRRSHRSTYALFFESLGVGLYEKGGSNNHCHKLRPLCLLLHVVCQSGSVTDESFFLHLKPPEHICPKLNL